MRRILSLLPLVLTACQEGNPENSFACGIAAVAGPMMVLEQFGIPGKVMLDVPDGVEGVVPARVVGHGTARALAGAGPDGVVLGYEGEHFPNPPAFGLIVAEDSLDTFQGVLIFATQPPPSLPLLGSISSATTTLPLYGLRVNWTAVSNEQCPLFGSIDSVPR
jgi:hypothetical protein